MTVKLLPHAGRLALGLLLALVVGALGVVVVVPRAVDGAALTVLTGSMAPTIPVGSVVVVQPVDPRTLRVGDVVTYQQEPGKGAFVTHRITAVHTDTDPVTLTTKGDANRGPDSRPVPVTSVRGRVLFSVPYLGTVRNAVSTGGSGPVLLVLGLVAYGLAQAASALRDRGRQPGGAPVLDLLPVATSADTDLVLQALVVTLPTAEFDGLSAASVAQLLRMDLLDEGDRSFTVAVIREPDQLDDLMELLSPFLPLHVARSEVVAVPPTPTGHLTSPSGSAPGPGPGATRAAA